MNTSERPMKVFPVRYKWNDENTVDTYYIVAETATEAEEIAYSCIAANMYPSFSEGPPRPSEDARKVATVWVQDTWAANTVCTRSGLLGTGSELYNAKAYAAYVEKTGLFA